MNYNKPLAKKKSLPDASYASPGRHNVTREQTDVVRSRPNLLTSELTCFIYVLKETNTYIERDGSVFNILCLP